jgi:hypothetical protein
MDDSVVNALDDLRCSRCEYQLQGLNANRLCPECGYPISRSIAAVVGFGQVAGALRILASDYLLATLPGLGLALKLLLQPIGFAEVMKLSTIGDSPKLRRRGQVGMALSIAELICAAAVVIFGGQAEGFAWFGVLCVFALEVACFVLSLRIAIDVAREVDAGWINRSLAVLLWCGPLMFAAVLIGGLYGAMYDAEIALAAAFILPIPLWLLTSLTFFQLAAAVRPLEAPAGN